LNKTGWKTDEDFDKAEVTRAEKLTGLNYPRPIQTARAEGT